MSERIQFGGGEQEELSAERQEELKKRIQEIGKEAVKNTIDKNEIEGNVELSPEQRLAFAYRDKQAVDAAYKHDTDELAARFARESYGYQENLVTATDPKTGEEREVLGSITYIDPETGKENTISSPNSIAKLQEDMEELAETDEIQAEARKTIDETSVGRDRKLAEQIFDEEAIKFASKDRNYIKANHELGALNAKIEANNLKLQEGKLQIQKNPAMSREAKVDAINELKANIEKTNNALQEQADAKVERLVGVVRSAESNARNNYLAHKKELKEIDKNTGDIANPGNSSSEQAGNWRGVGSWREMQNIANNPDAENNTDSEAPENPENPEKPEKPKEKEKPMEVPALDFGEYPEMYARVSRMWASKESKENLEIASANLADSIKATVDAQVHNKMLEYIANNPEATDEEIKLAQDAAVMTAFIEAQGKVQKACLNTMDGLKIDENGEALTNENKKVEKAEGIRNRFRQLGAFIDKHGKKIATAMTVIGTGVAIGGIISSGGIAGVAFAGVSSMARGAGIGAVTAGIKHQFHGSKTSNMNRDLFKDEDFTTQLEKIKESGGDVGMMAEYLMKRGNDLSANSDNKSDRRNTGKEMAISATLGGLMGAIQLQTARNTEAVVTNREVPKDPPAVEDYQIGNWEADGSFGGANSSQDVISKIYNIPQEEAHTIIDQILEGNGGSTLSHPGGLKSNPANAKLLEIVNQAGQILKDQGYFGTETVKETIKQAATELIPNTFSATASAIGAGIAGSWVRFKNKIHGEVKVETTKDTMGELDTPELPIIEEPEAEPEMPVFEEVIPVENNKSEEANIEPPAEVIDEPETPDMPETPETDNNDVNPGYKADRYQRTIDLVKNLQENENGEKIITVDMIAQKLGISQTDAQFSFIEMQLDDLIDDRGKVLS